MTNGEFDFLNLLKRLRRWRIFFLIKGVNQGGEQSGRDEEVIDLVGMRAQKRLLTVSWKDIHDEVGSDVTNEDQSVELSDWLIAL